ncbi:MAG: EpsG family protein [Methyloprofundus sp.]|nr:EpsG family protein [Methyloprofundus sp.]
MIYIFGWATIYFAFVLQKVSKYKGRFFALIVLFIFAMTAFMRGSIGTDTPNYEQMFLGFANDYSWNGQEPGFVLLGWLFVNISPSFEIAVRLISVMFFILLTVFLLKSNSNERYLLLFYLLPVFAYSYSMNGLRAGLAFGFILLAVQLLRLEKKGTALTLGMVALTFHYSALLPLLYLALSYRKWLSISNLAWAGLLIFISSAILIIAQDYFLDKLFAYSMYETPSGLSGFSILIPSMVLLFGVMLSKLPAAVKWKLIVLASVFYILAVILTQYSYAGLRILDLLAYAFPLAVLLAYSNNGMQFDRVFLFALFASGIVSIAATYYRFMSEYGVGLAPWLPYVTWFDFN